MPEAQTIEALNVHSFDSEPGSMGVTGQTTDGVISIGFVWNIGHGPCFFFFGPNKEVDRAA